MEHDLLTMIGATCSVIEIMMAETSDSSDEEEVQEIIHGVKQLRRPHGTSFSKDYVVAIHYMSDETFKSHFRLRRDTFAMLLQLLGSSLRKQSLHYGRHPIAIEKQLLIALWIMATPDSYRSVCEKFQISKSTAWRCVWKVVRGLNKHLPTFIKWPTVEEARATWTSVYDRHRFPKVLGAVDGTHIKILKPKYHSESYINRKGVYSVQTQIVCDHRLRIIHVYAGEVGSVHDARVMRVSGLQTYFTPEKFPNDCHLLADKAYTIQQYVMVPYRNNGNLDGPSILYNTVHASARLMVERTIGLLKGRFRSLLDTLPIKRIDLIPFYIVACCILHNICILNKDLVTIPIIVNNNTDLALQHRLVHNDDRNRGIAKREAIKASINYATL